jgi:hypothetical protein
VLLRSLLLSTSSLQEFLIAAMPVLLLAAVLAKVYLGSGGREVAGVDVIPGSRFELICGIEKPGRHRVMLELSTSPSFLPSSYGIRCRVEGSVSGQIIFTHDYAIGKSAPGGAEKGAKLVYDRMQGLPGRKVRTSGILLGKLDVPSLADGISVSGMVELSPDSEIDSIRLVLKR